MYKGTSPKLSLTILSLSLITVMAGAAVSPALGQISQYFKNTNATLIQMILTVPGMFILITNLLFTQISKRIETKTIALLGLTLYVLGGIAGGLVNNIYILLLTRAFVGIGVGMIMPLSTGLLAYFFDSEQQSKLMGYSAAMNNLGGMIAMSLSGFLAAMNWRYSFFVYLIGIIVFILVIAYLPNIKLKNNKKKVAKNEITDRIPVLIEMFLVNFIFYLFITNFSMISVAEGMIPSGKIGLFMSVQTVGAMLTALLFGKITEMIGNKIRLLGAITFAVSYLLLATGSKYPSIVCGLLLNGIGFGVLIPWLNMTIVKRIAKDKSTEIMSFMSVAMYSGQFFSPITFNCLTSVFGIDNLRFPYFLGAILAFILLALPFFMKGNNAKNRITASLDA